MLKSTLGRLRVIGFIEGISFLLILGITMPLKYWLNMPEPNKVIGLIHGILFVLYILAVIQVKIEFSWSIKRMFILMLASLIPFGTFYTDKKYLR